MNNQDRSMMDDAYTQIVPEILKMNQEEPFLDNKEIKEVVINELGSFSHLVDLSDGALETLIKDITEECAFKIGGYKMMNTLPVGTLMDLNIDTL